MLPPSPWSDQQAIPALSHQAMMATNWASIETAMKLAIPITYIAQAAIMSAPAQAPFKPPPPAGAGVAATTSTAEESESKDWRPAALAANMEVQKL